MINAYAISCRLSCLSKMGLNIELWLLNLVFSNKYYSVAEFELITIVLRYNI